jgi:hypothetical protein
LYQSGKVKEAQATRYFAGSGSPVTPSREVTFFGVLFVGAFAVFALGFSANTIAAF